MKSTLTSALTNIEMEEELFKTRRDKALLCLIVADHLEYPKPQIYQVFARHLINLIKPELDHRDISFEEINDGTLGNSMKEYSVAVARLEALGIIEPHHSKDLFRYHFKNGMYDQHGDGTGYDIAQAIIHSKILDEESNDVLIEAIKEALIAFPNVVKDVKNGKDKAIGSVMGFIMKKMKADPAELKRLIIEEINKS